jgi:hypothetical protein
VRRKKATRALISRGKPGRAIYEKGGLNLANLDDEQQIEAEDNYRSCVTHGSDEEAKPKRKQRRAREEGDESEDHS